MADTKEHDIGAALQAQRVGVCKMCGVEKRLKPRRLSCPSCISRQRGDRPNRKAQRKEQYKKSKENDRARCLRWKKRNPERASILNSYEYSKDKYKKLGTTPYEANAKHYKKWRDNNGPLIRLYNKVKGQRTKTATPHWANLTAIAKIYSSAPDGYHVDHIIPIMGLTPEGWPVSGLHIPINLQYLTAHENMSKNRRMRMCDLEIVLSLAA